MGRQLTNNSFQKINSLRKRCLHGKNVSLAPTTVAAEEETEEISTKTVETPSKAFPSLNINNNHRIIQTSLAKVSMVIKEVKIKVEVEAVVEFKVDGTMTVKVTIREASAGVASKS